MLARIMKIKDGTIVLKTEKEDYLEVDEKELDFDHKLGDVIEVDADGDSFYFLPVQKENMKDFGEAKEPVIKKETTAKKKDLKGVSGWLAWFNVSLILSVIIEIVSLGQSYSTYGNCSKLDAISKGFCSEIQPLLAFENIATITFVIIQIILVIKISQQKKNSINLAIGMIIAIFIWDIIDALIAYSVFDKHLPTYAMSTVTGQVVTQIARGAVFLLWVPYFKKSERVKQTLTRE